ncbi:MAG: Ger(x)C family spore germination protein [Bacillota bacterium]|nr:Ger(x)C family spore germination protein [Bacillota bacterium]
MRKYAVISILLINMLLPGCWDAREINELGLVMAVGVDKSENEKGGYRVSVQIAKPSDAAGGGPMGGGGGGSPVWVGAADGQTIFDAIRNVAKFSSRRVMWAHNNVIIIGEGLAQEGITPIVDFFSHNPELRMKTWVAVTRGKAEGLIGTNTGIEKIPGISIARLYLYGELPARSIKTDMVSLLRDYKSETIQPLLSELRLITPAESGTGSNQIELEGGAVFKKDKLVGFLSAEEARGLDWMRGEARSSIITVFLTGTGEKAISVELRRIKVKVTPDWDGQKAKFNINFKAEGSITEQDGPLQADIDAFKSEVQKAVNDRVKRNLKTTIKAVQTDFNSDVVGFGRTFHIKYKDLWNKGLGKRWPELYSNAVITFSSDVKINTSTLFQEPIYEEKIEGEQD